MSLSILRLVGSVCVAAGLCLYGCGGGAGEAAAPRFLLTGSQDPGGPAALSVMELDAVTGEPTARPERTKALGSGYPQVVAVHPSRRYVYVGVQGRGLMGFSVDLASGQLSSIAGSPFVSPASDGTTEPSPTAITFHPSGRWVFVAHDDGTDQRQPVDVFAVNTDTGALTVQPQLGVLASARAHVMTSSQDGQYLYVGSWLVNELHAFSVDGQTGKLKPLPGSPYASTFIPFILALHPKGRWLYTVDSLSDEMVALPLQPDTGVPSFSTAVRSPVAGLLPSAFLIDPQGRFAYSPSNGSVTRLLIDPVSGSIENDGSLAIGDDAEGMVMSPDGTRLYAMQPREKRVTTVALTPSAMRTVARSPVLTPALTFGVPALW